MMSILHNHALGLLTLRLMVGCLMLFHGVAKVANPDSLGFISGALTNMGLPSFIAYGVYIGEVIAPLMIILGIYSRYAGLLVIINMIFAILLVHAAEIFSLTQNGGWAIELQAFYLLGAIAIVFLGSGRLAFKPD